MPDATRATVSATEMAMLLSVSPYGTRYMLFQRFAKGVDIDRTGDARMSWGTKMEPLILAQAAEDLALEVTPNRGPDGGQTYFRRGLLGATRDATVITPDRGPGALDAKCVFDYGIWMTHWGGGKSPPKHVELQIQQQMYVGDGRTPFDHGRIACWVCGEMVYFEREPIASLWLELEREAAAFMDDVKAGRTPDPFGDPVEAPFLAMLDRPAGSAIDLSVGPDAVALAEKVRQYRWEKNQVNASNKAAATLKAQILAAVGAHESAAFFGGIKVRTSKVSKREYTVKAHDELRLDVYVPDNLPDELIDAAREAEVG